MSRVDWPIGRLAEADLAPLSLFFKSFSKGKTFYGDMDLFHWKIWRNPNRPGFVNAIRVESKIVSTTSLTPKKLWFDGRPIIGAEIGDTYTDPGHLRKGMFAQLINRTRADAHEAGLEYVYGL
ncbi:MAG: GNAT family N-acetyltransferase, partial [Bdellovibrionota bacterium]